jgi:four helix bundle protein
MAIASKESRETHDWLRLAKDGHVLQPDKILPELKQIDRIIRILTSIIESSS